MYGKAQLRRTGDPHAEPFPLPLPTPCTPLVKWAGGKAALLPDLVKLIPKGVGRVFEPFAGGAALTFHRGVPATMGDVNLDLMNAYALVAREPKAIIAALALAEHVHRKDPRGTYYQTRNAFNVTHGGHGTPLQRAVMFLYLNRTCFNGLWRVNRQGEMNTPMGRYKNPAICDPARIFAVSAVLKMATLRCGPWQTTIDDAVAGDLVYFDPPYVPTSATANFTGYTAGGFGDADQVELAAAARALVARGVHVLASNSDCKRVRSLYRGFKVVKVKRSGSISSNARGRAPVGELILVGTP